MNSVFVAYLEALCALPGTPGSAEPIEEVIKALSALIQARIKRWELLEASPQRLYGVSHHAWKDAFRELAVECYIYTFHDRRTVLLEQPRHKIDGLVALNVKHFLVEQGRKHNPIGYRTQSNVKSAAQGCVRDGELRTVEPGHLGAERGAILADPASSLDEPVSAEALKEWLRSQEPWAELTSSLHRNKDEVRARLARIMVELAGQAPFKFWDLRRVALTDARAAVQSAGVAGTEVGFEEGEGDARTPVLLMEAKLREVTDGQWRKINTQVERAIEAHGCREKVKLRLHKLWRILVNCCVEGEAVPSQVAMAGSLGVSTSTLSEDMQRLQEIFRQYLPDML